MRVAALVVLAACGRIAFDRSAAHDGGDGVSPGDAVLDDTLDAPPNAITTTIGACATADLIAPVTDTWLDPTQLDDNFGRSEEMRVGNAGSVSLLRFDVSALGTNAQIISTELEISVGPSDALEEGVVEVRELLEAWDEGDENDGPGIASWRDRQVGVAWSIAGAGSPSSSSSTAIGTFTPDLENVRHVVPLIPSPMQGWVADPATNQGLILVAVGNNGAGGWLSTSEAPGSARPCLRVTYTP